MIWLLALSLGLGCGNKKSEVVALSDDPSVLVEAAWNKTLPPDLAGQFSIDINAPRMGIKASASGGLLVSHPDQFRVELHAPIVGPRFYGVSDGEALNLYLAPTKTWYGGADAAAVLDEATGGAVGLADIVAVFVGRMPFRDAELTYMKHGKNNQSTYEFSGPEGSRAVVQLDERHLTTHRIRAFDPQDDLVLEARYKSYRKRERTLLPHVVEVRVPRLAFEVKLEFRDWDVLKKPGNFELKPPPGSKKRDLVEAMKAWGFEAPEAG